jgi:hypothetical protein
VWVGDGVGLGAVMEFILGERGGAAGGAPVRANTRCGCYHGEERRGQRGLAICEATIEPLLSCGTERIAC